MLHITTKKQYFSYLDEGYGNDWKNMNSSLKGIQDASVLHEIGKSNGLTIADVGGGNSRIVGRLKAANSCYIIDRFEGVGSGPIKAPEIPGVSNIVSAMGDFSADVPENFFDIIVSISVVEHVPNDGMNSFFRDIMRCLKSGGKTFHAVDLLLGDQERKHVSDTIYAITSAVKQLGFKWIGDNLLDKKVIFCSSFASMSDIELMKACKEWWKTLEAERQVNESQYVNLMVGCYKP